MKTPDVNRATVKTPNVNRATVKTPNVNRTTVKTPNVNRENVKTPVANRENVKKILIMNGMNPDVAPVINLKGNPNVIGNLASVSMNLL